MSVFKNLVEKPLWKISKNLVRDYNELSILSTSQNSKINFAKRSLDRAEYILNETFASIPCESFQLEKNFKALEKDGMHFIAKPLSSIPNLSRAIPFFSTSILQLKKTGKTVETLAAIISFPALGQVFYTEKGQGAWLEQTDDSGRTKGKRLRVSNISNTNEALVSSSYKEAIQHELNHIDFGCSEYEIAAIADGKLDAIFMPNTDVIGNYIAKIFTVESGGTAKEIGLGTCYGTSFLLRN